MRPSLEENWRKNQGEEMREGSKMEIYEPHLDSDCFVRVPASSQTQGNSGVNCKNKSSHQLQF